jgi:UDP-glucose 4-epimerase
MILVIGGLGFVGSNTTEALLKLGEDCVVTRYEKDIVPSFLKDFIGKHLFVEQVDVMNLDSLMAIGKKYPITGIVNLVTGGMPIAPDADALELVKDVQATVVAIANSVKAASEWGVKRVTFASAPVVYNGITDQPWKEDQLLPLSATNPMELAKKYSEILSSYLGTRTGVECI